MPRVAGTEGFGFNHTMIRVKDPNASLEFYQVRPLSRLAQHEETYRYHGYHQNVLGMSLIDSSSIWRPRILISDACGSPPIRQFHTLFLGL